MTHDPLPSQSGDQPQPLRCSFCGGSRHEVAKLIAGPGTAVICDGCVWRCVAMLHPGREAEAMAAELAAEMRQAMDAAAADALDRARARWRGVAGPADRGAGP